MIETILCRQRLGGIAGSGVASECTERDHRPILTVQTDSKCREVQVHDMPGGHTQVRYFRGDSGTAVHDQGGNVL